LGEALHRVERILYRTSDIGRLVGEFVLGGMVLLIVADIVLRYIFNSPLSYSLELVEVGLAVVVFFAIVVCTADRGHINIDIFLKRFPERAQAAINSFFYLICTGLFGLLVWRCTLYAMRLQDMGQVTMMLRVPYYPFVLVMALCSLLASLVFLSQFIRFVVKAVRK
jgi:TRAP-type C4-dicarboxylate transport system permease small subunit